jgi:hypothetical protein
VKLLQKRIGILDIAPGQIAQDDHLVFFADFLVPFFDHICVHLVDVLKTALIHVGIHGLMKKMEICNIISHKILPVFW